MTNNKEKKNLTQKQQKLLDEILGNLGNKGFTKSMYQMMLDAGYSKNSAREQSEVLSGIEGKVDDIVLKLEKARDKAISKLDDTIDEAKYHDLSNAIEKLTKQIQLLQGKPTSNVSIGKILDDLEDE